MVGRKLPKKAVHVKGSFLLYDAHIKTLQDRSSRVQVGFSVSTLRFRVVTRAVAVEHILLATLGPNSSSMNRSRID